MDTDKVLREQTEKWLKRLEKSAREIKQIDNPAIDSARTRNSIANVHAYISDAEHFMKEGDMVRAFEAVIYAWGILETLQRLGLVEE